MNGGYLTCIKSTKLINYKKDKKYEVENLKNIIIK